VADKNKANHRRLFLDGRKKLLRTNYSKRRPIKELTDWGKAVEGGKRVEFLDTFFILIFLNKLNMNDLWLHGLV